MSRHLNSHEAPARAAEKNRRSKRSSASSFVQRPDAKAFVYRSALGKKRAVQSSLKSRIFFDGLPGGRSPSVASACEISTKTQPSQETL
jgi:hypothetical protein